MVNKNTQIVLGAIALAAGLMIGIGVSSAPAQTVASSSSELCTFHNAAQQSRAEQEVEQEIEQEPVIILGNIPDAPYVVAVLKQDNVTLDTVRQCVPDAFQTRSRSGSYIRAGAFPQRSTAEKLSRHLRTLDLDARVIYLP